MIDQLQTTTGLRMYARYLEDTIKTLRKDKSRESDLLRENEMLWKDHRNLRKKYSQLSALVPKTLRDYTSLRKDYLKTQFRLKEAKKELSIKDLLLNYHNNHLIPQYHDYINSLITNKNG